MDQTTEEHVPVLIAGGGPVGLTLAALLSRQGIRSQVIEADEGYCTGSRAICISRRSQEIEVSADGSTRGVRVRQMLDELGPTFVKFGQLLSTRPDVVPPDIVFELKALQDDVSPFPYAQVEQVIREDLELTVAQSGVLHRRLNSGHLDLVFVKNEPGDARGQLVRRDRLVWVGTPRTVVELDRPVPLVAYQAPSFSRTAALRALERAGRTWRITCNVKDINGALAALRAGIGVAVFPQNMIPGDLVPVTTPFGLPMLGEVDFALLDNPRAPREPVEALIGAIVGRGVGA